MFILTYLIFEYLRSVLNQCVKRNNKKILKICNIIINKFYNILKKAWAQNPLMPN